jgi:predicted nucleotidyltransferase component of viral defense system
MEHRMNLHENKILFRQAVQFTADQLNIPAVYVEKDYWITYVLHTIFSNEIGKETIFKGGTALSKSKLIDRFSEMLIWSYCATKVNRTVK